MTHVSRHQPSPPQVLSIPSVLMTLEVFCIARCAYRSCISRQNVHCSGCNSLPTSSLIVKKTCRLFQDVNLRFTGWIMYGRVHHRRRTNSRHQKQSSRELIPSRVPKEAQWVRFILGRCRKTRTEGRPGRCIRHSRELPQSRLQKIWGAGIWAKNSRG